MKIDDHIDVMRNCTVDQCFDFVHLAVFELPVVEGITSIGLDSHRRSHNRRPPVSRQFLNGLFVIVSGAFPLTPEDGISRQASRFVELVHDPVASNTESPIEADRVAIACDSTAATVV